MSATSRALIAAAEATQAATEALQAALELQNQRAAWTQAEPVATTTAKVFSVPTAAIVITTAGDLTVTLEDGSSDVTLLGLPADVILPMRISEVDATNVAVFTAFFDQAVVVT